MFALAVSAYLTVFLIFLSLVRRALRFLVVQKPNARRSAASGAHRCFESRSARAPLVGCSGLLARGGPEPALYDR